MMTIKGLRFTQLFPPVALEKWRGSAGAVIATAVGGLSLTLLPALKLQLFARASAALAGLFLGTPMLRFETGWMLPADPEPILVTSACSGVDFWLMAASLSAWQLGRRQNSVFLATWLGLLAALPFTILVNSLRIVALTQAHRWFIPLWPRAYAPLLHLLTGVAVFLPALILLHVLTEHRSTHRAASGA